MFCYGPIRSATVFKNRYGAHVGYKFATVFWFAEFRFDVLVFFFSRLDRHPVFLHRSILDAEVSDPVRPKVADVRPSLFVCGPHGWGVVGLLGGVFRGERTAERIPGFCGTMCSGCETDVA